MTSTLPNDDVTPSQTDGEEFATDDPERDDEDDATAEDRADRPLEGDERMYTGEVVDTESGPRRPQQMNVGVDNMEGGGEWPDPHTPPSRGAPGGDSSG